MQHSGMQWLTSAIFAAFFAYIAAWFFGGVQGDFSLLLFVASTVTGLYWLAERAYFWPQRRKLAARLELEAAQQRAERQKLGLAPQGQESGEGDKATEAARAQALRQPWWLDWTAGLFPVIVMVFLLRSFVFEPFRIPSGSMIPTLLVGDFILVNKFTYGLKLPIVQKKITEGRPVRRGDVVVFRYPPDPRLDYIKRVVGLPGDEVAYLNKRLSINGQDMSQQDAPNFFDRQLVRYFQQHTENLDGALHNILTDPHQGPASFQPLPEFVAFRDHCAYGADGVRCTVPAGHYLMMGDNRDNSQDSRSWGFVPEQNIVGRAFVVWLNLSHLGRVGQGIR